MKLKKIVSLALAGVLAVSMLAGCSNGTSNNNGSSSSEQTTTSSSVADVMNAAQKNVKFKAGTSAYLADAAKKATYANLKDATVTAAIKNTSNDAVAAQLNNKILPGKITFQTSVYNFATSNNSAKAGKTKTVAYLYMVDDVVSEEVAATLVANAVAGTSTNYPVVVTDTNKYEASYTGEVTIQKVSKSDELGENTASAYYVLVTVTQTVGSTAVTVGQ